MYLKSVKIQNFRKFGSENNIVCFSSNDYDNNNKVLNSTLIVGQNNAGKTSIIKALQKVCGDGQESFSFTDFNYYYLRNILANAIQNKEVIKKYIDDPNSVDDDSLDTLRSFVPFISLTFSFKVDVNEDSQDLLTNIGPLVTNDIPDDGIVSCVLKYETENLLLYTKGLFDIINNNDELDDKFDSFLKFIGNFTNEYSINCYVGDDEPEKIDFKFKGLLKINLVSFEKLHSPSRLTEAFNKIYRYKVTKDEETKNIFDKQIENINSNIDETIKVGKNISDSFNKVLSQTTDSSKVSMQLKANLSLDSLLNNVIKYVYKDGSFEIPEDQFGLGYTNLMLIISELVDYVDNAPESDFYNKINLLVIEEPESYMHPQMQKVLIENINGAFQEIIKLKSCFNEKVNCQIIITSHSPFVLSGKIGVENTFNNVDYIRLNKTTHSSIIPLKDSDISTGSNDFEFLKRYIRFKCCELFFADAAVLVEGLAEETILPYYLSKDEDLNKKYISFFNINGAYFYIYEKLVRTLGIPVVILTDLDLLDSKDSDDQITTLDKRVTTNNTLKHFGFDIEKEYSKTSSNIYISTQNKCGGFYATSFEEALILANPNNGLILETLKEIYPEKYANLSAPVSDKSHGIQKSLSGNKGKFCATLLYKIVNNKNEELDVVLPQYIVNGFDFIKANLK